MIRTGRVFPLLLVFAAAPFVFADGKNDDKKDEIKLTGDEQALIDLTNAERAKADKDLKPLKMYPKLMEAARKHAENMAAQDKLDHVLDEKNPADRVKAAGYKYRATGENILWNAKTPKEAVAGWMDSPPHRESILKPVYTEIGVGIAKNKKGEPYWVQVFGAR
jgi:uncharacterized protein YkwD